MIKGGLGGGKYFPPIDMRTLGVSRHKAGIARNKPHSLGSKPKGSGFNIFGAFKRAAKTILSGLKTVVVAAGNIAQEVLNVLNTFPFLKPIAEFPVPIPGFGAIRVKTLLKGIAITGRVTERLANAMEVYANGGSFKEVVAELPISDLVMFVLSPILESFKGVLSLARVPESQAIKRIRQLAEKLKVMFKKIPPPIRLGLVKGIQDKLGIKFPPDVVEGLVKA